MFTGLNEARKEGGRIVGQIAKDNVFCIKLSHSADWKRQSRYSLIHSRIREDYCKFVQIVIVQCFSNSALGAAKCFNHQTLS